MVNPVVLICTHERIEITETNIRALLNQSIKPKIVLVCSRREERDYFIRNIPEIDIVAMRPNNPLGKKFQDGVKLTQHLKPDPLIITGSDDILGADFIKKSCWHVERGSHFIGIKQWFIYHRETIYLYEYTPKIPLGTRVYSLQMLEKIEWKVFDTKKNRLLDDHGYHAALNSGLKIKIITDVMNEGFKVVSVKGDWPMLNPFDKMKGHPNLKLIRTYKDASEIL